MLSSIIMLWVLSQLGAPSWAYVVIWASLVLSFIMFIMFCVKLVEAGNQLADL